MRSSLLCILTASSVHAALGLSLPNLAAQPSVSPAQQAIFDAVQRGYQQFQPLLTTQVYRSLSVALGAIAPGQFVPASQPLVLAFNAASLSASQADGTALELALQCVNSIIISGGMAPGYNCVNSGKNTYVTYGVAFDTVLEQFVGIVPPSTLSTIQTQVASYFQNLGIIPPVAKLNTDINNALISVVAQASAETVTAIQRMQGCYNQAISQGSLNTAQNCYQSSGPMTSYQNIFNGIANQFVGILPSVATEDLINTYMYYMSQNGATPGLNLVNLINQGILSIAAATAGNGATALIQIQTCFSSILMGADSTQTSSCFVRQGGPISTLETIVISILNTGFGTLPPSLVITTGQQLSPMFEQASPPTAPAVRLAIQSSFNTIALTPAALSCSLAIIDCVNIVMLGQQGDCFALPKCSPVLGTGLNIIPRP